MLIRHEYDVFIVLFEVNYHARRVKLETWYGHYLERIAEVRAIHVPVINTCKVHTVIYAACTVTFRQFPSLIILNCVNVCL